MVPCVVERAQESHGIKLASCMQIPRMTKFSFGGRTPWKSKSLQFYQPTGLCMEFNHVVYACDAQRNCIKILTSLKQTATFFNAVETIYKAFSTHKKHQPYSLSSIQEAVELIGGTLRVLRSNKNSIRDEVANLLSTLHGLQGNVVSKTVESIQMLKCGIEKLQEVLELHRYDALN